MIILVLTILGLCLGSFIKALVWRLHEKKNWVSERSVCVHCGKQLAGRDLIPVLSWLWLHGKCRYCKKPISAQYPIVESLTALSFIISYVYWPKDLSVNLNSFIFVFWLVFLVGLIALALYDIKWMKLPDKMLKPFYILAIVQASILTFAAGNRLNQFIEIATAFSIGFGLFYVLFQISSGKWIGGGDVKLGGLLGLILASPSLMVFAIFSASVLGTVYSLPLIAMGKAKKDSRIPFGPFLIAGTFLAMLFGQSIINWYQTKILVL